MERYEFTQNNTGGNFIVNKSICHRLFIEAKNKKEAIEKAEELGCYWNGVDEGLDCPCCGSRRSDYCEGIKFPYKYDKNTYKNIEDYAQMLADKYGWTKPDCRVFYADGNIKEIFSKRVK